MSERQNQATIVVAGTAIAAAALVFVSIPAIILTLATAWAKIRIARYPSSDDAFGWGVLISAPLQECLQASEDLHFSLFSGAVICRWWVTGKGGPIPVDGARSAVLIGRPSGFEKSIRRVPANFGQ